MATEQKGSQLVEVRNELELGMDTDPVAEARMHVFRNVAGHWAVSGLRLPNSLDVPGVLSYGCLEDLVDPCPISNAGITYHGYTAELDDAVTGVLRQYDPDNELELLTSGTAHAITHEASQRLGGYADIMFALGKSEEQVLELLEVTLHEQDRATERLRKTISETDQSTEDLTAKLRGSGIYLTRMLINFERHATQDVIANRPISAGIIELPVQPATGWRGKLRSLLGGV